MGADVCGIMDSLGLDSAHLVGASMGGMVAQIVAGTRPSRVRSISLLITSDNSPAFTRTNIRLAWHLGRTRIANETDWIGFRSQAMAFWRAVQGSRYRATEAYMEEALAEHFRRGFTPAGVERQAAAIMATGALGQWAARIRVPALIMHGSQDPLIHSSAAHGLKQLIPHAHLILYPGMGHDLPETLAPRFAHQIRRVVNEGEQNHPQPEGAVASGSKLAGVDHGLLGTL
jgi:pimeloyl-ACP methyl ester carboxylesterase